MRTLQVVALLMAGIAFALMGCSETSGPLSPSIAPAIGSPSLASGLPEQSEAMHSATGSMHLYPDGESKSRTFAFAAYQLRDGSFSGEYQAYRHAVGDKWHGKVISLNVDGNKALVVGVETSGFFAGWWDAFVAIDNGEGANDTPDLMSFAAYTDDPALRDKWLSMTADAFVADFESQGIPRSEILYPIQMGNIQVR